MYLLLLHRIKPKMNLWLELASVHWVKVIISQKVINEDNQKKKKTSIARLYTAIRWCSRAAAYQLRTYIGERGRVLQLCHLEPLKSCPRLWWHAHPANVHLQMIRLDNLLSLQGTLLYRELNRSTITLPSARHLMQSDFLRLYKTKLCKDSKINYVFTPVGTVHRLAALVLCRKQVCEAATTSSAPLYRCDGVGDKFTHPVLLAFLPGKPACPMQ